MMILLIVIGYLICGILAYGACYADLVNNGAEYAVPGIPMFVGLVGPIGLITALPVTMINNGGVPFKYGFQWKSTKK